MTARIATARMPSRVGRRLLTGRTFADRVRITNGCFSHQMARATTTITSVMTRTMWFGTPKITLCGTLRSLPVLIGSTQTRGEGARLVSLDPMGPRAQPDLVWVEQWECGGKFRRQPRGRPCEHRVAGTPSKRLSGAPSVTQAHHLAFVKFASRLVERVENSVGSPVQPTCPAVRPGPG